MTTSIPLRVFTFTSALKNILEKGENWWRELRDIHFSMIAEKPRKIKFFSSELPKRAFVFECCTFDHSDNSPYVKPEILKKYWGQNYRTAKYSVYRTAGPRINTGFSADKTDTNPKSFEFYEVCVRIGQFLSVLSSAKRRINTAFLCPIPEKGLMLRASSNTTEKPPKSAFLERTAERTERTNMRMHRQRALMLQFSEST